MSKKQKVKSLTEKQKTLLRNFVLRVDEELAEFICCQSSEDYAENVAKQITDDERLINFIRKEFGDTFYALTAVTILVEAFAKIDNN